MPVPFLTSIDLNTNEVLNASFQKLASDPASPGQARFWYHTGDDHLIIQDASARRVVPFVTNSNPVALTVGGAVSLGSSLDAARSDHSHAMPGLATTSSSGFMSSTHWNMLNDATALPTATELVLRDSNGRSQVADPAAGQDIATYAWTLSQIDLARQGLAFKDPVRVIARTALPTNTYNSGTKRLTASANAALGTIDGVSSWAVGDRIAVGGEATGSRNGLYKIIQVGSVSLPWILERTSDFGGPGTTGTPIYAGAFFVVNEGTEYGDTQFVCTNNTVTIDTTAIVFTPKNAADVDGSTITVDANGNLAVLDAGITYAKFQNLAACSVFGRSANSAGVGGSISAGADNTVLSRASGVLAFTAVANAMLATMPARSVKVNATNSTAVPTDLQASAADRVLQVNSGNTGLEWGTVRTNGITAAAVTYAKIQNVSAQYRVLGRISSGAGVVEELTPANLRALMVSDISTDKQALKKFIIGDGTNATLTITHNFGTQNIASVTFKRISDQQQVYLGWTAPTANTVVVSAGSALTANSVEAYIHFIPN